MSTRSKPAASQCEKLMDGGGDGGEYRRKMGLVSLFVHTSRALILRASYPVQFSNEEGEE